MISKTKNSNSGFSLIEVIIALSILSFLMILITNTWSGNFLRIRKSKLNSNIAQLLERKATEIEAEFTGRPLEEIPKKKGGVFDGFKQYRWEMTSREFEMPDLTPLFVGNDQGDESLLRIVQETSKFITKSVKEVKVSIFLKVEKAKEREYSVVMYMVSYDEALEISP